LIRSSSLDTVHSIDQVSGGSFILTIQIDILHLRYKNGRVVVVVVAAAAVVVLLMVLLVLVFVLVVVVMVVAAAVEDVVVVAPAVVVMIMVTSRRTGIRSSNTLFKYFNCSCYYTGSMILRASQLNRQHSCLVFGRFGVQISPRSLITVSEVLRGVYKMIHENFEIQPPIKARPLSSVYFPIHYFLITQRSYNRKSEILTASLNKH
jgi:hypothetical protein